MKTYHFHIVAHCFHMKMIPDHMKMILYHMKTPHFHMKMILYHMKTPHFHMKMILYHIKTPHFHMKMAQNHMKMHLFHMKILKNKTPSSSGLLNNLLWLREFYRRSITSTPGYLFLSNTNRLSGRLTEPFMVLMVYTITLPALSSTRVLYRVLFCLSISRYTL